MKLVIISPEKIVYSGETELVTLPGLKGRFTILNRHAPIISGLDKGTITYHNAGEAISIQIEGGFVEAKNNIVTVCVD
jgi:F-type H+-transporting ATPase subunit epsilon